MSVEAYIPYDLRERLAEQIKVIDKMMLDAVAAERERCAAEIKELQDDLEIMTSCYTEISRIVGRQGNEEHSLADDVRRTVTAERERCERVIGGLMYESYDISGPECLSRALIAIRKGE